MKQKLTITGMFNDVFTNYEDKISSISIIVDIEEECECFRGEKCSICKLVERGELTEIISES